MEIDYKLIDKEVNKFAIDVLYEILDKYSIYLGDKEKETLVEKIAHDRVLVVEKPNKSDTDFFKGDIPIAHGPRTKNDGLIHIYPYIIPNTTTEEIIKRYIEHIITHELYHFIIKLDINDTYTPEEIEFGHYITEGMVQLFAELHNGKKDPTSKYRKNVNNAKIIYEACMNNLSQIFQKNYKDIFEKKDELAITFTNFQKEKQFSNKLNTFFKEIAPLINWEEKRLIAKAKMFSIDDTLINLKKLIESKLSEENAKYYTKYLDEIYESCFEQNKKSLN